MVIGTYLSYGERIMDTKLWSLVRTFLMERESWIQHYGHWYVPFLWRENHGYKIMVIGTYLSYGERIIIIIIIGFLINVQVQGHHPHQWAPFQVTG